MASLTFTVTRSGDTTVPLIIDYTTAGTGANPVNAADHLGGVFPAGRITIPAGSTTGSIVISSNPDTTFEPDETGLLTITSPTSGVTISPSTAVYTFLNDDAAPGGGTAYGPTVAADTGYVDLGANGGKLETVLDDTPWVVTLVGDADGAPSYRVKATYNGYITGYFVGADGSEDIDGGNLNFIQVPTFNNTPAKFIVTPTSLQIFIGDMTTPVRNFSRTNPQYSGGGTYVRHQTGAAAVSTTVTRA